MRVILSALFLLSIISCGSGALAETDTAAGPPVIHSAYCSSGAGAFTVSDELGFSETRQKCKPGDTILLPGASTGAIAKVCDFSRSVVATAGSVICVLASQRSKR